MSDNDIAIEFYPTFGLERPYRTAEITETDIEAIESLSDAAIRAGHIQTALKGYALALRLRSETGLHPQRRAEDATS